MNYTPLTICQAEIASSTCFWWLGTLSKRNSPCTYPPVSPSKMSIMWSTWASRLLAVNQPSQFFPGQKITQDSLCRCEWECRERASNDTPVVVMQRAPICSQKVQNHQGEALSLQFWNIFARTPPIYLALVVLVKRRFIMGDENKMKVAYCPGHKEA